MTLSFNACSRKITDGFSLVASIQRSHFPSRRIQAQVVLFFFFFLGGGPGFCPPPLPLVHQTRSPLHRQTVCTPHSPFDDSILSGPDSLRILLPLFLDFELTSFHHLPSSPPFFSLLAFFPL